MIILENNHSLDLFVCVLTPAGGLGAYPTYSPVPDTMR